MAVAAPVRASAKELSLSISFLFVTAQPGLDYQRLQTGLDLKSVLPMHSGDMVGQ